MHPDLAGQAVALAAVAGRAGGDDVLPDRLAAATAGDDVVDGEPGLARAAVLAGPGVAGEHRPPGDLAAVCLARDPHVADEADHVGTLDRHPLRVQGALAALQEFGLLLEKQDSGSPQRADVDRLIRCIEYEYSWHRAREFYARSGG